MLTAYRGTLLWLGLVSFTAMANDVKTNTIADIAPLTDYASVLEFEADLQVHIQECLDKSFGGSGAISCFISREVWDRELNFYYQQLKSQLNKKEQDLLYKSQISWIKERDKTVDFNSALLDKNYPEMGTMYQAMRAGEADRTITPIIKSRVLYLKYWAEKLSKLKTGH
jgi:uncharacterized protein YecT (DUF1311 family)